MWSAALDEAIQVPIRQIGVDLRTAGLNQLEEKWPLCSDLVNEWFPSVFQAVSEYQEISDSQSGFGLVLFWRHPSGLT